MELLQAIAESSNKNDHAILRLCDEMIKKINHLEKVIEEIQLRVYYLEETKQEKK